jgi:lipoyl(octanoyl) transferase
LSWLGFGAVSPYKGSMKTALKTDELPAPEWRVSSAPVPYPEALAEMERRVDLIEKGLAPELFWLLEHPPLYTAGTSADPAELTDPERFPVFKTGRGGRYTYHGPGQRVIYALCDLRKRDRDVRQHVCRLEEWVIRTLAEFGIKGERREGRIGIWVEHNGKEEKIAAIGVRVRRWITYHGLALNVNPELSHFGGIVPCGLPEFGVTSLRDVGVDASMEEVDAAFRRAGQNLIF